MATYQGKTVTLNKPSRVTQGEPGYGRKKFKVFVSDNGKVKKVMFGDPNMTIKRMIRKKKIFRARHKCDTLKIKQHQDIGLVKCGKEYGRRKKLTMSRLLKRIKSF